MITLISAQIQVLLLAVIAPWLYDRYLAFSPMAASRPGSFRNVQTFKSHGVKYQNELRNCEHVVMEKSVGIAFLSCDAGRDRWNTVMVRPVFYTTCMPIEQDTRVS